MGAVSYWFIAIAVPAGAVSLALLGQSISYTYTAPVPAVFYLFGCMQVLKEVVAQRTVAEML